MSRRHSRFPGLFLIFSLLIGVSCQQTPDNVELTKHMVVQTEYDTDLITPSANIFNTYSTFTMRIDTMGFVSTYYPDTILLDGPNDDFVKPVTRAIRDEFQAAGFTRVDADQSPDFAVNVVVLHNFSFYQSVNYGGYYGGYYGYYNYYYPVVTTSYSNFVTMVVQVVDIKNYTQNGSKYRVIWTAYVGDIGATPSKETQKNNTLEAVETALIQSPYISAN